MPLGRLAQTARAPARHAGGHWFKSSIAHLRASSEVLFMEGFMRVAALAASFFAPIFFAFFWLQCLNGFAFTTQHVVHHPFSLCRVRFIDNAVKPVGWTQHLIRSEISSGIMLSGERNSHLRRLSYGHFFNKSLHLPTPDFGQRMAIVLQGN